MCNLIDAILDCKSIRLFFYKVRRFHFVLVLCRMFLNKTFAAGQGNVNSRQISSYSVEYGCDAVVPRG